MKIILKATNFKLTPSVEDYVREKIGALDKFINPSLLSMADDDIIAHIELIVDNKHHHKGEVFKTDANIKMLEKSFRAEAQATDMTAAIDGLRDKISLEFKKYKGKKESVFKKGARAFKNIFKNF